MNAGVRRRLAVGGGAGVLAAGVAVGLVVGLHGSAAAPTNDDFSRAAAVSALTIDGTTSGASVQSSEVSRGVAARGERDVWYVWRPSATETVDLIDARGRPALSLWTGSTLTGLHTVVSQHAAGALQVTVRQGDAYRLQVAARGGQAGPFSIAVQPASSTVAPVSSTVGPPANDNLSAAEQITGSLAALRPGRAGQIDSGRTEQATAQPGESAVLGHSAAHSVWYSVTVPAGVPGHRLTLAARPAAGGMAALRLSVDAGTPQTAMARLRPLAAGSGAVSLVVPRHVAGLVVSVDGPSTAFTLSARAAGFTSPDRTPPVVHCGTPPSGWTTAVAITCTAHDAGSGLVKADRTFTLTPAVAKGEAAASAQTSPRQICDQAGNCTTVAAVTGLQVDRSPPDVVCDPSPVGWVGGQARVHCRTSDTGSGLADAADASFWLRTSVPTGQVDPKAAFSHHPSVCDVAGNCSAVPVAATAEVDRQAPTVTCGHAPAAWSDQQGHVTCTASDEGSGLSSVSDARVVLDTAVVPGAISAAAQTTPQRICDEVGNCTTAGPVGGFRVDLSPPTVSCTTVPARWVSGTSATVGCTAADVGSGLATGSPAHLTLSAAIKPGTERVVTTGSSRVCDVAGNCVTAGPYAMHLDDAAPVVRCATVPRAWQPVAVSVQCTASDQGSGLATGAPATMTLRSTVTSGRTSSAVSLPRRTVCDVLGHCTETPRLPAGRVDRQAPVAHCAKPPAGMQSGQVSIRCAVQDSGSGLASPAQAAVVLSTAVRAGQVDRHAATNSVIVCDAVHNCVRVGPLHAAVDRTHPATAERPAFAVTDYIVAARATRTSRTGVVIDYPLPVATGAGAHVSCIPAPGSSEPPGSTTGSCTATGAEGQSVTIPMRITTAVIPSLQPGGVAEAGRSWSAGATGFAADAPVLLSVDGQALGQVAANGRGIALTTFRVPRSAGAGDHQLTLSGRGPTGSAVVVTDRLAVTRAQGDAVPSFGGRATVLGRLALAGAAQPLGAIPAAAVPTGETFGGGAPQHFATVATHRHGTAGHSLWWLWLVLCLGLGALATVAVTAARRRRTHLSSGGVQ